MRYIRDLKVKVKVKVKVSLCFNLAPRNEDLLRSGGIAPRILDLGTRCRWVVSFTPRPLYPQGKNPWCILDRRLGGAPETVWTRWWREKFRAPPGTRSPDHQTRSPALCHWAIPAPCVRDIEVFAKAGLTQVGGWVTAFCTQGERELWGYDVAS
jgi:hypothetical protein